MPMVVFWSLGKEPRAEVMQESFGDTVDGWKHPGYRSATPLTEAPDSRFGCSNTGYRWNEKAVDGDPTAAVTMVDPVTRIRSARKSLSHPER